MIRFMSAVSIFHPIGREWLNRVDALTSDKIISATLYGPASAASIALVISAESGSTREP